MAAWVQNVEGEEHVCAEWGRVFEQGLLAKQPRTARWFRQLKNSKKIFVVFLPCVHCETLVGNGTGKLDRRRILKCA